MLSETGITIKESMTTPSRPGKKPRPVWIVSCPVGYEEAMVQAGGRKYNGTWSFWSDPTEAIEKAIQRVGRLSFAERLEAKKERAEGRADRYRKYAQNANTRAASAFQRADQISERFALGQPILVGHHSEKRARKDQERMHNAMGKGLDESRKSEYWNSRAAGADRTAETKDVAFMSRRGYAVKIPVRQDSGTQKRNIYS